jgi:DNA polymerase III epsilon subunit-like protein
MAKGEKQMIKKRYISIDIETTGLDPEKCQVLEIGAVIENWELPIIELPTFQCYVKYPDYCGNPYALALNSRIFEILAKSGSAPVPRNISTGGITHRMYNILNFEHVDVNFTEWLRLNGFDYTDRITVAGKNFASFDLQFLKRLPNFQEMALRFRHRYIDPVMLYWEPDIDGCNLPNLKKCLTRAGISNIVTHEAVDDARLVIKLIRHYYDKKGKLDMR